MTEDSSPEPTIETSHTPDPGLQAFTSVMTEVKSADQYPKEPWYTSRGIIAIVCLGCGAFLGWTFAGLKQVPIPPDFKTKPAIVKQTDPPKPTISLETPKPKEEDLDPSEDIRNYLSSDGTSPEAGNTPSETNPKPSDPPGPMDPFQGGSMPAPLTGELPPMPTDGLPNPNGSQGAIVSSTDTSLVTGTITADTVGFAAKLQSIARSHGGNARAFDHMGLNGQVESRGVLIIVPAAKLAAAVKALQSSGVKTSPWEGSAASRQQQLRSRFTERLDELTDQKKKLLVDWQEGAQPVKEVEAAMEAEARAIAALRLGPGSEKFGLALVMVKDI